jgi:hypothetical protein
MLMLVSVSVSAATDNLKPLGNLSEGATTWHFFNGAEFPGAKGSLDVISKDGGPIGVINYDFSEGGNYVFVTSTVDMPAGYGELRIKVRANAQQMIGLRLIDEQNQVHQLSFSGAQTGEWQTMIFDLLNFKSKQHWGGPNDGRLYFPVKKMQLMVLNSKSSPKVGAVEYKEVQLMR